MRFDLKCLKLYNKDVVIFGLILFTLPISIKLNSFAIIIAALYFMIRVQTIDGLIKLKYFFPSFVFFIIQLGSFAISSDFDIANKRLILYLPFVLFPFFFALTTSLNKNDCVGLFKFLMFGVLAIIVYGCAKSIIDVFIYDARFDYGYGIDLFLKYTPHHVYLSIFMLISICFLFEEIRIKNNERRNIVIIIFMFTLILFLSSRTALFISVCLLPLWLYRAYGRRYGIIKFSLFTLFCCGLFVCILMSFDYTRDKLIYFYFEIFNVEIETKPFYGVSDRIKIWTSSIELLGDLPLLGYGIGDIQYFLNSMYSKKGYYSVMNMNTHNQYLQSLLNYGILQSIVLFYILIKILVKVLSNKNYFLFYSWIIILTFSFTESILNRQWGVILFAFLLNFSLYQTNVVKN